jgi:hypothetical protein
MSRWSVSMIKESLSGWSESFPVETEGLPGLTERLIEQIESLPN